MARVKRVRRTTPQTDNRNIRVGMEYRPLSWFTPYDFNPRDNAAAVDSVAESIRNFGFIVPIIAKADGEVSAGHTRLEAAKKLGLREAPVILAEHLTAEQINAFRLIDNKVAELAKWDFDLLAGEMEKLKDSGIQLTDFGWTQSEIDCLSELVQDDCLATDNLVSLENRDRMRNAERRAPTRSRFVLGEIVFFIPATAYRSWIDGIRAVNDYNEQAIVEDLSRRLGLSSRDTETPE